MPTADTSLLPAVAALRRFNRAYTRFLGTLNHHYLRTEYSLAEGRVLYELATRTNAQANEVGAALGLDAGYLSRILSRFEKAGLVTRTASSDDGRVAYLGLTAAGRAAIGTLNRRADKQAGAVLAGLTPRERVQFTGALRTIEQTVLREQFPELAAEESIDESMGAAGETPSQPPITLRAHRPGDMGMVVALEGAGYVEQFGWDGSFEELVARIVADFLKNFDPACERCWVAEMEGRHVGHIFLVRHPEQPGVAKLRLLYVDPAARGRGLGQRLVGECVQFAREAGYGKITLWTQSILTAAHRIYQAAGFRLVKEEPHHSFGKDLVGQTWELRV